MFVCVCVYIVIAGKDNMPMKVAILGKDMGEGEKRVWDALFTPLSPYLGILIKRTTEADMGGALPPHLSKLPAII